LERGPGGEVKQEEGAGGEVKQEEGAGGEVNRADRVRRWIIRFPLPQKT